MEFVRASVAEEPTVSKSRSSQAVTQSKSSPWRTSRKDVVLKAN